MYSALICKNNDGRIPIEVSINEFLGGVSNKMSILRKENFARGLRKNPTRAEQILYEQVRGYRLFGLRLVRQKIIVGWIVDLYFPSIRLIVELVGPSHDTKEAKAADAFKDARWRALGYKVIRFRDEEIFKDLGWCILQLATAALGDSVSCLNCRQIMSPRYLHEHFSCFRYM